MRLIIHTAGATAFSNPVAYKVRVDDKEVEICASLTVPPLAYKLSKEDRVKVLILLPHSMVSRYDNTGRGSGEESSGGEIRLEEWLERATNGIVDIFLRNVREKVKVCSLGGGELHEESKALKDLLERAVDVRLIQVKGAFSIKGIRIEFEGDPAHTFVEVYRWLEEQVYGINDREFEIYVDTSQGWNYLTVSALLAALAFSDVVNSLASWGRGPRITVSMESTEPYMRGVSKECVKGGTQSKGSNQDGSRSQEKGHGYGNKERYKPSSSERSFNPIAHQNNAVQERGIPLGMFELDSMYLIYRVLKDISEISSGNVVDLERVASTWSYLEEYEESASEYRITVMKAFLRLRRALCAFASNNLPYLYWSLRRLNEVKRELAEVHKRLKNDLENGDYMKFSLVHPKEGKGEGGENVRGTVNFLVRYRRPPIMYPLVHTMLRISEVLLPLYDENYLEGEMPLGHVTGGVYQLYLKRGMNLNLAVIENELRIDDQGNSEDTR